MFARRVRLTVEPGGRAVPLPWLDSFAMRSFTGDAAFDDTLPVEDGVLEAGLRVPLDRLGDELEAWLRRKGRMGPGEHILLKEQP